MIAVIQANWLNIVVGLLAVDAALIPIFPNAGILKTIQTYLTDAKSL